jgi:hypothetical protein
MEMVLGTKSSQDGLLNVESFEEGLRKRDDVEVSGRMLFR